MNTIQGTHVELSEKNWKNYCSVEKHVNDQAVFTQLAPTSKTEIPALIVINNIE